MFPLFPTSFFFFFHFSFFFFLFSFFIFHLSFFIFRFSFFIFHFFIFSITFFCLTFNYFKRINATAPNISAAGVNQSPQTATPSCPSKRKGEE